MKNSPSLLAYRWHRTRARLGTALRREGSILWASLRDPFLAGLLLLALLLASLAFQGSRPFTIHVGQQPPDLVYLDGVYPVETSEGRSFRWSRAEAVLRIPGLGRAAYRLDLTMAAPRLAPGPEPHLHLVAGPDTLLDASVGAAVQVYTLLLSPEALRGGNLELLLRSDVFTPTGDPRQLGLVLQEIEVRPAGGPVLPSATTLLWSVLTVLLVVLLARRLGWSRPVAFAAGLVGLLALAAALAWARPLLTPGLPYLSLGLFCAWAAVVLFQGAVRRLLAWGGGGMGARTERLLWTVLAFFLAVRLAGMLHPAMETFDLCFHLNRMQEVMRGKLLLTIISREWRSQETLYLPSLYLLVAPFWVLVRGQLVPFKVAELLLDTSAALLTAYIARRLLGRGAAPPLAALFYLTMRQSYIIFSWGIVSNMLGQWLLLLVLALFVAPAGRLERWRAWLGAAGLLFLAVLAHPGTVQLTGLLLVGILLTVLLAPLRNWPRPAAWRWLLAGTAAVLLSVVLYYSYFVPTMWQSLQQMGGSATPCDLPDHGGIQVCGPVVNPGLELYAVEVFSPAAAVVAGAEELAAEAQAYYFTGPLLLAVVALPGLALERRNLALRLLGLAFWLALAYALVGLATNLYVRYMYFLLPFIAIGFAWWIERLARHGWAGRVLARSAALLLLLAGIAFWVQQVLYYAAGCRW